MQYEDMGGNQTDRLGRRSALRCATVRVCCVLKETSPNETYILLCNTADQLN